MGDFATLPKGCGGGLGEDVWEPAVVHFSRAHTEEGGKRGGEWQIGGKRNLLPTVECMVGESLVDKRTGANV